MDDMITVFLFLTFAASVLILVLLIRGLLNEAGDRDLLVDAVLQELEERRRKNGK